MANTFTLIASVTVGSGGAATLAFSSIPSTYTDILLVTSLRDVTSGGGVAKITFNGSTSSYTARQLVGNGSSAYSDTSYGGSYYSAEGSSVASGYTANTFSNGSFYIPNYAGSNNKSISTDTVVENNATSSYAALSAGLWSNSSAISSITITQYSGGTFAQYSTAYLYGIKNS